MIIAQGANIGGWSLYAKNGKLKYCYNVAGVHHFFVEATEALAAGEHQVRMEFAYAGEGLGLGGDVTLLVDGTQVGSGSIERTIIFAFGLDVTGNVGVSRGSPVSERYPADTRFRGDSGRFRGDIRDLRGEGWNDRISSMRVDLGGREDGGRFGDLQDERRGRDRRGAEDADRIVRRAYQDVLGRDPDAAGLQQYRSRIIDDGWNEQQVRDSIRTSPEFRDRPFQPVVGVFVPQGARSPAEAGVGQAELPAKFG